MQTYKIILNILLIFSYCIIISCKYNSYFLKDSTQQLLRWKQQQECLSKISNYQVRGVLVSSCLKTKNINLRFFFQKINHKYYRLVLTDLIGFKNITIHLVESKEYCLIDNRRKNCFLLDDFDILIKKITNIDIPFKYFQEWMLGLSGTNKNFILTLDGNLKKIKYQYHNQNFEILYKNYFYNTIPALPKIIEIHYNSHYYFNIKIYSWII